MVEEATALYKVASTATTSDLTQSRVYNSSWPGSSLNVPKIIATVSPGHIRLHFDRRALFCTMQVKYLVSCILGNVPSK